MTYQILPLLVACLALVAGMLLGKQLAKKTSSAFLSIGFGILLIVLFVTGNVATSFAVGVFQSIGLAGSSQYLATGLLSLLSGFLFGHLLGGSKKPESK